MTTAVSEYPIRPQCQEEGYAIDLWCQRRGIDLDPEDYDAFNPPMAWPDAETEVRWGREFEQMRADVMDEIMCWSFDRDHEMKYRDLGKPLPMYVSPSEFTRKYPELDGFLY